MTILLAILLGLAYSEFVGYWIHRLLHSEKIPSLSKDHMIHHLRLYSPKSSMRSETYRRATGERFSVGNIGIEWFGTLGGRDRGYNRIYDSFKHFGFVPIFVPRFGRHLGYIWF